MGSEFAIYNCGIQNCRLYAVKIAGFNSLNTQFYGGEISGCPYIGMYVAAGSANIFGMAMENPNNMCDFYFGHGAGTVSLVHGVRSEGRRAMACYSGHQVSIDGYSLNGVAPMWSSYQQYGPGDRVLSSTTGQVFFAQQSVLGGAEPPSSSAWSINPPGWQPYVQYSIGALVVGSNGSKIQAMGAGQSGSVIPPIPPFDQSYLDGSVKWMLTIPAEFVLNHGEMRNCQVLGGKVILGRGCVNNCNFSRADWLTMDPVLGVNSCQDQWLPHYNNRVFQGKGVNGGKILMPS